MQTNEFKLTTPMSIFEDVRTVCASICSSICTAHSHSTRFLVQPRFHDVIVNECPTHSEIKPRLERRPTFSLILSVSSQYFPSPTEPMPVYISSGIFFAIHVLDPLQRHHLIIEAARCARDPLASPRTISLKSLRSSIRQTGRNGCHPRIVRDVLLVR